MDKEINLLHWDNWARSYGKELLATTKCQTIKKIEVDALARHIRRNLSTDQPRILEIGCGNGFNIVGLMKDFPQASFFGIDFSEKMIQNARTLIRQEISGGISKAEPLFGVLDVRQISSPLKFGESSPPVENFDFIFTDRMLINLASAEEQLEAMRKISTLLKPGGFFLVLENCVQSHAKLNEMRQGLGLKPRTPAAYNIFIDENKVIEPFKKTMRLIAAENISGLHDLLLYAVGPAANGGQVEYDTPLMKALTEAILMMDAPPTNKLGQLGQNMLWVWQTYPT